MNELKQSILIDPTQKRITPRARLNLVTNNPVNQFIAMGVLLVIVKILSLAFPDFIVPAVPSVISAVMVYSIMSIGFCLLLGYSGLASLGTAGFVGIGAYTAFYIMNEAGLPYLLAIIVALIISILLGLAVGFISLRIEGIYLAIITLGLSEIIRYALKAIYSGVIKVESSHQRLFGIKITSDGMFFVVCIMFVLLLIITYNLFNSPTGRAMLAMKNSTSAAQAYGISLLRYRLLAFIIATVYATLGGIAYLIAGNAMSPSSEGEVMLKLALSLNVLGAVIIGGYKSLWGTVFGCFVVFGLRTVLSILLDPKVLSVVDPYLSIFIGVLVIVIVMFYPGGLAQLVAELKVKLRRTIKRYREAKYGKDI